MKITQTLISASEIETILDRMAREISSQYGPQHNLVMICLLKGSVMFFADLVRRLPFDVHLEFMSVSSYGSGTQSSGDVRIQQDLDCSISNRHVLLVEDIVDSGHTFAKVLHMLQSRGPASLRTVSLLSKPSRRQVAVPIDFVGKEIEDVFVCGYGLDYDQKFRNLPYIGILSLDPSSGPHDR